MKLFTQTQKNIPFQNHMESSPKLFLKMTQCVLPQYHGKKKAEFQQQKQLKGYKLKKIKQNFNSLENYNWLKEMKKSKTS